jgi:glycosyltransferase involved in cell wall biosynthesis
MGIGQSLIWLDHAFNMPAVYSAMDCYVQSSILEGFSNVLAEAMSCGVPCVATDVGATESILGQEGILVRQGEPGSLASGIHELIEGDIRTSPGSRNRVMDLFSVHAMVEQTLTVFRELLR